MMRNDRRMNQAMKIIQRFGGVTRLARALGHRHTTTVDGWRRRGWIPGPQQQGVLDKARELGIDLTEADFFVSAGAQLCTELDAARTHDDAAE